MKIFLPVETKSPDAPICPAFARAPYWALYDTQSRAFTFTENDAAESQGGAGIKAAQALVDGGAGALVAFRCGENAAAVLNAAQIQIYRAITGSAAENAEAFANGTLAPLTDIHAGYHRHGGAGS